MASAIFNEELNEYSRKLLIKGNEHLINKKENPIQKLNNLVSTVGEQLLIHDSVSIKVYGENFPLPILIKHFGLKNIEALIEQGALNFVLWTPGVTFFVDDIPGGGVYPLQSMGKFSGSYGDPEESIINGLKSMTNPLPRKIRRDLVRKVEKHYIVPSVELSKSAVEFGHQGYKDNLFESLGLPYEKDLLDFNRLERQKLCSLATQCLDLTVLSKYNLNSYNNFDLLQLNRKEFQRLRNVAAIETVVDEVFKIEEIPAFAQMFSSGILDLNDISKLRDGRSAEKFREWIEDVSNFENRYDITRAYMESITQKTFIDKPIGKLTRMLTFTALGAGLAGPLGAVGGIAADLGISLFDTYILDGIAKGWSPKHYIEKQVKPNLIM